MTSLQPSDYYEHDVRKEYVVDVFGRMEDGKTACVRIKGFKPFFYVKSDKAIPGGIRVRAYDVLAGFNGLTTTEVWKVSTDTKADWMKRWKELNGKHILYETNIPPFLRLFHACHLNPGSPFLFKGTRTSIPCDPETEVPLFHVDAFFQCDYTQIQPAPPSLNIPMKVACYDLEMYSESGLFPSAVRGDPIIQMGISYRWSDNLLNPIRKRVFVVGDVSPSDDPACEFVPCADEKEMLRKFAKEIRTQNPDVMCGYNTFGFDDGYMEDRCAQLGITDEIDFTRNRVMTYDDGELKTKFSERKTFELASGKYDLRYLALRGRLGLDLLLNMRREHSLDSFTLDNVASVFLKDKVLQYERTGDNGYVISSKSTRGLCVGNYVRFDIVGNTADPYRDGEKFLVTGVSPKNFVIRCSSSLFTDLDDKQRKSLEWCFSKDDVDHEELFQLHANGGPQGRARIAKYCIQDCDLVLTLMAKLDTLVNARGMADVCKVPMDYVLRRGQGIKIFSAVLYYASQRNQILRTQESIDIETSYEGAVVISPKIGMYLDQPISVLDFNSLYPTNMIAYNISPDTLVSVRVYDAEGRLVKSACEGATPEQLQTYRDVGWVIEEIEYDNKVEKVVVGKTRCFYVQPAPNTDMSVGLIPKTLDIFLKRRKEFKTKMEDTEQYDEAQRSVYNGLQLAYKVVANSVYGQTGSQTSPIRKLCVAASTTAAGRKMLYFAKSIVESEFGATVVYGDSVAHYTPVTIRQGGQIAIVGVEELGRQGEWKPTVDGEKEYCELSGVESWTEDGWTTLHRIIRHRLAPHKKMVRVRFSSQHHPNHPYSWIDVTDDHSMLYADKTPVSPRDLKVGDTLLCGTPGNVLRVTEAPSELLGYSDFVYDLTTDNHHFQAGPFDLIVHNTDSIFIKFPTKELVESIRMGIEAGERISSLSRRPYKIAYEKTFYPFILFCRKRYVGMMYEEDPSPAKAKRKSMGIVLKRRDNAPIVKDVYGGALDILIQEQDIQKAQTFVEQMLLKILENRIPLEKYIITKSLRDDYKMPGQIAHRVLADRMAERDPGTAPRVGDRVPYVYVAENKDNAKQGDRIEHIDYVRKHGLTPDAQFYITNQVQNPVAQLFALCIEELEGYKPPAKPYDRMMATYLEKYGGDEEEATKKVLDAKEKQLEDLMFLGAPAFRSLVNRIVHNTRDLHHYFTTTKR